MREVELGRGRRRHPSPPKENTSTPLCPVTLPNVQILEVLSQDYVPITSSFPSCNGTRPDFVLDLPQLVHFYFRGGYTGKRLELEWLTPFALRGLKSLILGVSDTLNIEWSEFPNLEGLACLDFEPNLLGSLPKTHPLQQVWLLGSWSLETFDGLTAGLEEGHRTNLRRVHLWEMRWDQEGGPVPTLQEKRGGSPADYDVLDMFCDKVDRFEELYGLKTLDYYRRTRDNPYQEPLTYNGIRV